MNRPFRLGLTGSIGMGKSTTAKIFAEEGIPVWDADAAVHRLYDGPAAAAIAALHPPAVVSGRVDRAALRRWIDRDHTALGLIEKVIHPMVAADRIGFIDRAAEAGARLVVLDIPLLFETGGDAEVDATLVVTAPAEEQRARVMDRPGMTSEQFEAMLARQMPDDEKRARADFVIETRTMDGVRSAVRTLIARLMEADDA